MRPRFCAKCDPYFRRRRDMEHTYDEGCESARPGIPPRPWTDQERKNHQFVEEVERLLEKGDGDG